MTTTNRTNEEAAQTDRPAPETAPTAPSAIPLDAIPAAATLQRFQDLADNSFAPTRHD